MYSENELLPISLLADIAFCPRRAALHGIEEMWEDNLATVEGSLLHQRTHDETKSETRTGVRISRGLRLRSLIHGLVGVADIVEFHETSTNGVALPDVRSSRIPFPVEYKRGHLRHERGFEIQLCAQAICLEEMLGVKIPAGAIFYGKTHRRLDVEFNEELRRETAETARRLHELIKAGKTPSAVYTEKCESCSIKDSCMPKMSDKYRSVDRYVHKMTEGEDEAG